MALSTEQKESLNSWFEGRDWEYGWAEKLMEVAPLYEEMGFTRDTGAILYMLSNILMQVAKINSIMKTWDEKE